tara:strand:- start:163 stop:633 length:471 start_codon:yes stop_codon:yes gene_type:complete
MYNVGQILYTVLTDKQIVVPVKIVEQVIVKTLDGEKVDYKLQLPNTKNQKVSIDKFTNLYEDILSVEEYLTLNAKSAIEKMIKDANTLNNQFFSSKDINNEIDTCKNESNDIIINKDQNNNSIKFELENGQKASINLDNINKFVNSPLTKDVQKKT